MKQIQHDQSEYYISLLEAVEKLSQGQTDKNLDNLSSLTNGLNQIKENVSEVEKRLTSRIHIVEDGLTNLPISNTGN